MLKDSPMIRIITAVVVAMCFMAVLQGTLVESFFFGSLAFLGYIYTKQASLFLVCICTGVVTTGILASVGSELFGVLSHKLIICGFATTFFFSVKLVRRWTQNNILDRDSNFLSVVVFGVAALLIWRWPINSPSEFIGFLSYEDNAAWTSTVAAFTPQHAGGFISGSGGFVLDPLMSLLYGIRTVGLSDVNSILVYEVTVATYGFLQFIAVVSVGLFIIRTIKPYKSGITLQITASLSAMFMMYIALQLPRSTGHLTFVGAIALITSMLLISTVQFTKKKHFIVTIVLVSAGVVGMWWPYLLVVIFTLFITIFRSSWTELSNWARNFAKSPRAVAVGLVLFVVALVTLRPLIVHGFASMSLLDFFRVNGGVQPVPGYLTLFGTVALAIHILMPENNEQAKSVSTFGVALGILLVIMHFVSYFVGPTFTPNYSYNKTLLLFSISMIPLVVLVIAQKFAQHMPHMQRESIAVCAIVIFGIGGVTTGWDLNNPRSIGVPIWSDQLLDMSANYPQAIILCTTSVSEMNFDAYLCSRHSGAIQNQNTDLTNNWRHLQLFPSPTASSIQLAIVQKSITNSINENKKVILLSLEDKFQIADEDSWWMNQLPLDRFVISTPRGELAK